LVEMRLRRPPNCLLSGFNYFDDKCHMPFYVAGFKGLRPEGGQERFSIRFA